MRRSSSSQGSQSPNSLTIRSNNSTLINKFPLGIPPSILAAYEINSFNPQDSYNPILNQNHQGNNFYQNNSYNDSRGLPPPPPPPSAAPYPIYGGASGSGYNSYPSAPPLAAPYGISNTHFPNDYSNNYPHLNPITIDLPLVITYNTKISLSAINVLPPYFPSLELLPQINLSLLPYSLETAQTQPPTVAGKRRKIFICPDLSPSAEPYNNARRIIGDDVEWLEVPDLRSIERVLEDENRRWVAWLKRDEEEKERRQSEIGRGGGGGGGGVGLRLGEVGPIRNEVGNQESELRGRALLSKGSNSNYSNIRVGESSSAPFSNSGSNRPSASRTPSISTPTLSTIPPHSRINSEISDPPVKVNSEDLSSRLASLVDAGIVRTSISSVTPTRVETFTPPVTVKLEQENDRGLESREISEPISAGGRKRARLESEGLENGIDEVESKRSPDRKILDSICKRPRRDIELEASPKGVSVNEAVKQLNNTPILGEQDTAGNWRIGEDSLGEITPQIQVLMARAILDAGVESRLRVYESPEATRALEEHVPWFARLINLTQHRTDLYLEKLRTIM